MVSSFVVVFMATFSPPWGVAVQCNVVCLSLTSGYAGRHGTSPIALLRDGGGGRKHQSCSTESFPDSARVKPANKGAGRSHWSAPARPPGSLHSSHACGTDTSSRSARTAPARGPYH